MCPTYFGHYYTHHQELASILLNYHIGRIVLCSMCFGVPVWLGWSGIRVAVVLHQFLKFIFGIKLYMFRTVPLSIIRSFSLYKQNKIFHNTRKRDTSFVTRRHLIILVSLTAPTEKLFNFHCLSRSSGQGRWPVSLYRQRSFAFKCSLLVNNH